MLEADLKADLAAARRDAERAKSDAAVAELARVTADNALQELEAEVDASKRALKAAEMAAATSAERAAEAECEARELRSHLAVQREKVTLASKIRLT